MHHWNLLATSWQGWLVLDNGPRAIVFMDGSTLLNADFYTLASMLFLEVSRINVCCNLKFGFFPTAERKLITGNTPRCTQKVQIKSYVLTEFENKKLLVGSCDTNKLTTIETNGGLPLPPYVGGCPHLTSDLATLLPPF